MSVGFDASGRAFRWLNATTLAVLPQTHVLYVPQGVPPLDGDEQPLWKPFDGTSQLPLRSQVSERTISIELAWTRLLRGDHPLTWTYSDGTHGRITSSRALAQSIAAYLDGPDKQGAAVAVPNLMDEDAQDALLAELAMAGFGNRYLIWRPVALALNWLHQRDRSPGCQRGQVWVVDFESAGVEVTRLGIEHHARDPQWLCPVRTYPTRTWDNRFALRPSPPCDPLFAIWDEWLLGLTPQPNRTTRHSLAIGPAAPSLQRSMEEDHTTRIMVCGMSGPRIVRYERDRRPPDAKVWSVLQEKLLAIAPKNTDPPATGDTVLMHGWVPRLWPEAARQTVQQAWPGVLTHVLERDAVAAGAGLYAHRRAQNLPTYYDAVPEYRVWCKVPDAPPGFRTVIPATKTEPGEVITLTDDAIRNAFAIAAHRESLAVIVQRHPVLNARTDFARRIRANLKRMASDHIALQLDARIEAAHGNAKFTFTTAGGAKVFEGDLSRVDLSYSRRGGAASEPEHKGYLEAQTVIGRVHDGPENVTLLRSAVEWLEGGQGGGLAAAVASYRAPDLQHAVQDLLPRVNNHAPPLPTLEAARTHINAWVNAGDRVKILSLLLERWGWDAIPPQDTRGLFGTRRVDDVELSGLANRLASLHFGDGPVVPGHGPAWHTHCDWHNLQNWFQAYVDSRYREYSRTMFMEADVHSYPQTYAPGFVLGDRLDDCAILVRFAQQHGFAFTQEHWANPLAYIAKYWWSFFRILCWHPEARITPSDAEVYLGVICDHLDHHGIVGPPRDQQDQRKNCLLAILFALRAREADPTALPPNSPTCQRVCNAIRQHTPAVRFPPAMVALMPGLAGDLSAFVLRFVQKKDTMADRELGASIATME